MRKKYSFMFKVVSVLLIVCMLSGVMLGCRKTDSTENTIGDMAGEDATQPSVEMNDQTQPTFETDGEQETAPSVGDADTQPTAPATTPTEPTPTTPTEPTPTTPTEPTPTTPTQEETILVAQPLDSTYYNGKIGVFIGDSITNGVGASSADTKYVKVLADKLGLASFKNLGKNGTTLCTDTTSKTGCNFKSLTLANCSGADVVTIMLGTNDFNGAVPDVNVMGTFLEDSTATVYGALNRWCKQIVEFRSDPACKDTKFFFVTPIPGLSNLTLYSSAKRHGDQNKVNAAGWTMREYCEALLKTCEYYKIPVLDLNRYGNMYFKNENEDHITAYLKDNVHPNDAGHGQIAEDLYQFLLMNPSYVPKSDAGNASYIDPAFAGKLVDRLQCTITFDNKGLGEQPQTISNAYRLPESLPVLSAEGYTFEGWYYQVKYSNEVKATAGAPISSDMTLYAKWTQN